MVNLIYIHIGENLPNYIFDSIYQSLLISPNSKIYVILNDSLISNFKKTISTLNLNLYLNNPINLEMYIECIPISILKIPQVHVNFINDLPEEIKQFRNAFWISTTTRFFYIESFMDIFGIHDSYHIENDIMIYENLDKIPVQKDKMYMVKDAPNRVVPSILFIPNSSHLNKLNNHIIKSLSQSIGGTLLNDMDLLGSYTAEHVAYFPFDFSDNCNSYIMDGAAIGQYLGGIDPRNIPMTKESENLIKINNPTRGFINETCIFKPNDITIFKTKVYVNNVKVPIGIFYGQREDKVKQINNLHIHSKELYQFSSLNNLKYNDLITGDRILTLCDFVLLTEGIFNYHKNLDKFIDINKVIIIKDFSNINISNLNTYFRECNKQRINLFIYTHILEHFICFILPYLDPQLSYNIYTHNSDHEVKENHINELLNFNYIKKIYAQNISYYHPQVQLLPIGIANSMFAHGDITSLYTIMSETYNKIKTHGLYININPNTYPYRHLVLEAINNRPNSFKVAKNRPYKEYLKELSQHRFCLCIRGNGIACHREWECYYLGVIPVIINNKSTNTSVYIQYLRELNLPFYEIKGDTLDVLDNFSDDFFNEDLYNRIISKCQTAFFNNPALKLSYYT